MISQPANLKQFVAGFLGGIVDWQQHVKVLGKEDGFTESGDQAHITIKTPYNKYKMSMLSAYMEPPMGAPVQCKSLGTVEFEDSLEQVHLVEARSDAAYARISLHIKTR